MKRIILIIYSLVSFLSISIDAKEGINTTSLPCNLFPLNNIWNSKIDELPVHSNSSVYINTIGANLTLKADFGSGLWNNGPIGIPYIIVSGNQAKQSVVFDYSDESDPGPYPIPENPPIEGGGENEGDRHILMLDEDNCMLYELYHAYKQTDNSWTAGSGAIFDLNSNELRPSGWTSADAAGLPILPGLVRYDEILDGEIKHAIRFTVPKTQRAYIWPARHYASSITDPAYPPMGLRMRLKSNYDISGFAPEIQVILTAMKKYGLILADNGSAWFMSGVPDERWNNDTLQQLRRIKGSDLEAVDVSSLMLDPNSAEAFQGTNSIDESFNSKDNNPDDANSDDVVIAKIDLTEGVLSVEGRFEKGFVIFFAYDILGNRLFKFRVEQCNTANCTLKYSLLCINKLNCTVPIFIYILNNDRVLKAKTLIQY